MEAGEGIGLTPAYYHGHDWEYLYPYSIPYVTEKVVVICASKLKEDGQTFTNWPADYSGLTFGNVSGYDGWGGPDFHAMVKNKQVNYAEVPSTTKNLLKLLTRQCHCIFFEKTGFKLEYERLKREIPELQQTRWQGIEIFDEISEDGIYIGYTNRNSNPPPWLNDFRRAVDNELYKMMQSKETRQIIESYEY